MEIISKDKLIELTKLDNEILNLATWILYVNSRLVSSIINEVEYCFLRDWKDYNGKQILKDLGYEVIELNDQLKVYHGIKF